MGPIPSGPTSRESRCRFKGGTAIAFGELSTTSRQRYDALLAERAVAAGEDARFGQGSSIGTRRW